VEEAALEQMPELFVGCADTSNRSSGEADSNASMKKSAG